MFRRGRGDGAGDKGASSGRSLARTVTILDLRTILRLLEETV